MWKLIMSVESVSIGEIRAIRTQHMLAMNRDSRISPGGCGMPGWRARRHAHRYATVAAATPTITLGSKVQISGGDTL